MIKYSKQFGKNNSDPNQSAPRPTSNNIGKKQNEWILPIIVVVIAMVVIATIGTIFFIFYANDNVKIIKVSHEPENPLPGEEIIITAIVENSRRCPIEFISFLADGGWGRGTSMERINDKTWEYKLDDRQLSNGTEIWVIVQAISYDNSVIVSDEDIIQIGNVERSDMTTLTISNIEYFPTTPSTEDTTILINVSVISNSTISKVDIGHTFFYSYGSVFGGGYSGGSGSGMMTYQNNSIYEFRKDIRNFDGGYPKGTKVLFRITAQDESGNTAVSSTISFIVS